MSEKKRHLGKWFWIGLLAAGLVTTTLAIGCTRYLTPEAKAEAVVEYITWKLDLDSSQQANVHQVAEVALELRTALHGQDGERHQKMHDLMTADTFDTVQAQSLYEQSRLEMDQYIPKLIHSYSVFHNSLRQDQRQDLSERLQRFHDHHH
jgi:hypothetical protein